VWWYWLGDGDGDIPLLPIQNPHVCIWAEGCRRYGSEISKIIHYCSAEWASVMSSASRRITSASPWSTPLVGWTSGCRRKHQWTLSILNVNY
jgi:hypothetical protein